MNSFVLASFLTLALLPGGQALVRFRTVVDNCGDKCRADFGRPGYPFLNDQRALIMDPILMSIPSSSVAAAPVDSADPNVAGGVEASPTSSDIAFSPPPQLPSTSSPSPSVSPSQTPSNAGSGFSNGISNSSIASPGISSAGSGSTSGPTSQSDIQAYLTGHNTVRAQHGAKALAYSQALAAKAQQWANGCVFKHSGGKLGPYGENLAAGTGNAYGISQALKSWTDEASQYNPRNPKPSHFTQVVWKGTTQVGCALQNCDGIFPERFGKAHFYVCEYYPQGNIIGHFPANVQV